MRIRNVSFALFFAATSALAHTAAPPQFQVILNDVDSTKLPALHSFSYAQGSSGKVLVVGGRTNGLHLFVASSNGGTTPPPNAFPTSNANQNFYVIDPVARQSWSAAVTSLPQSISDALSATNANGYSDGKYLYIVGGYGWSTAASQMVTFPTLTVIDVDATINAIIAGTSLTPHVRQTSSFYDCVSAGTSAYSACASPYNACSAGGATAPCPCAAGPGFADCVKAGFAACEPKRAAATSDCGTKFRAGNVTGLPVNTNGFYTSVAGGGMERIGNTFYLVFGHNFQGLYSVNEGDYGKWPINQTYTQRVVALGIKPNPLSAAVLTQLQQDPSDPTSQFHRRDLNVIPGVDKDGSTPLIQVLGGVFVPGQDAAYRQPILISPASTGGIDASLQTFQQAMSQYDCAVVPLVNRGTGSGSMTSLLLGGISLYYVSGVTGKLKVDSGLPFISALTALTRNSDGTWSEFYRVAPITINGKAARVGTDARFFRNPAVAASAEGVIYLDAIKSRTLAGWMYGGIIATAPNPGGTGVGTTAASQQLFEIWIDPTAPPSSYWGSTASAPQLTPTP